MWENLEQEGYWKRKKPFIIQIYNVDIDIDDWGLGDADEKKEFFSNSGV